MGAEIHGSHGAPVVLEGTLHGGSCGRQDCDGGAAEWTGGLHLHSLEGILCDGIEDGVGKVPDKVRQRLADLRRLWGCIQQPPQPPLPSMSETAASQSAATLSTVSAGAVCQGAVVQCRACHSAVACDSSTILAWLHGEQGQSQSVCADVHGNLGAESFSTLLPRSSEVALAQKCRAGNACGVMPQEGRSGVCTSTLSRASPQMSESPGHGATRGSDLRETLSPAGA